MRSISETLEVNELSEAHEMLRSLVSTTIREKW